MYNIQWTVYHVQWTRFLQLYTCTGHITFIVVSSILKHDFKHNIALYWKYHRMTHVTNPFFLVKIVPIITWYIPLFRILINFIRCIRLTLGYKRDRLEWRLCEKRNLFLQRCNWEGFEERCTIKRNVGWFGNSNLYREPECTVGPFSYVASVGV